MNTQSQTKNTHGGKRAGAGRPNLNRKTKVIRVVEGLPDPQTIADTFEVLWRWEKIYKNSCQSSPRWAKFKQFLAELPPDAQLFD